jgi:hypothetical protein
MVPGTTGAGGVGRPTSDTKTENAQQSPNGFGGYLGNVKHFFETLKPLSDLLSSWALVIVGFFGVRIALGSLAAIRDQVGSSRVAADAAMASAEAAKASIEIATRSAELAENALHLTERADILVRAVEISTYPALSPESVICIVFKNYGPTRGSRVRITSRLILPDQIGIEESPLPSSVLGAGDTLCSGFAPMTRWAPQEMFLGIREGRVPLRFETEAVYFDVFGRRHHTKCSGMFMPIGCSFSHDENQEAD